MTGFVCRKYLLITLAIFLPYLQALPQDYFQQEVNHKIHVTLDDSRHELSAFESIEYINNSPDTLRFIYFHLWPNAYSNNKTGLAEQIFSVKGKGKLFNDQELRGFIDSLDFMVKGKELKWNPEPGVPDICKVFLDNPLRPGDTIFLTTPFRVKIPKGVTSRLGHIGESYQISQWYPKPAVYDRSGWHQMPYLDQGEFYSEFGSFDVSITLPANYVVGATGELQNEDEKRFLDMLASDTSRMRKSYSGVTGFPLSSKELKTLHYKENKIHDFAWFADKRYNVRKGTVKLPESDREVTTWAMFTDQEAHLWESAVSYINSSVRYFSEWIGDYPYTTFTAIQSPLNAGAGMEYPGLTVVGLTGVPYLLEEVIAHEICHSWFYSALGSDERRFPFMDESLAGAYESRYMHERYPAKRLWEINTKNKKLIRFFRIGDLPVHRISELDWLVPASSNSEQPVNLESTDYSDENYVSILYYKAAQGFNYLRAYLGDSLFDSIMHEYYRTWKYKHPEPDDLRSIFESHTVKKLSWFFDDFLGTTKRLDYKIVSLRNDKLTIKNKRELNAPIKIAEMAGDSVISEKWEDGFEGKKLIITDSADYTGIKIDPDHEMTELYRLNNNTHTSGIFRKADPYQIRLLFAVEDPDKRSILYIPAFNWNRTDGFMVGIAIQNGTLLPKSVEYYLMPFYTFLNQGFTGRGMIKFKIAPYDNFIRMATFTLEGEQFGAPAEQNYKKVKIGADLYFRPVNPAKPVHQRVFGNYIAASDLVEINELNQAKMLSYVQFGYQVVRSEIINPFNLQLTFETGDSYGKTSLDFNYKYSYYGKNNGLEMRLFAGAMLNYTSADPVYGFAAGGRSGRELYLFDGIYPGRFDEFPKTILSRQMTFLEGGLSTPVNDSLGYSPWVCSLSLNSSLPGKTAWIPVKPFVNIALNDHSSVNNDKMQLFFEAGLMTGIWNFLEIYIPFFVSDNINLSGGSIGSRIRFVLKLDMFKSTGPGK